MTLWIKFDNSGTYSIKLLRCCGSHRVGLLLQGENMAKRRNQKKEKALRNQAYARKFRKRTNTGRFGRRSFDNRGENQDRNQETENQDMEAGASDAN